MEKLITAQGIHHYGRRLEHVFASLDEEDVKGIRVAPRSHGITQKILTRRTK